MLIGVVRMNSSSRCMIKVSNRQKIRSFNFLNQRVTVLAQTCSKMNKDVGIVFKGKLTVLPIIAEYKLRKTRFSERLYRESLMIEANLSLFATS